MNKIKIIVWYLARPQLYPQLFRVIKRKLFFLKSSDKNICSNFVIEQYEKSVLNDYDLFFELTGNHFQNSFTKIYSTNFAKAEKKIKNIGIKMAGFDDNSSIEISYNSGGSNVGLIFEICEKFNFTSCLETGVAYGWSSFSILSSLQKRKNSRLVSVDMPYPGIDNDKHVGLVVPKSLRGNWELLRLSDREGIPKAIKLLKSFDFCHYDSDKTYEGRSWSYNLIWEKLSINGILYSDDISDNDAFYDFCKIKNLTPLIGSVPSNNNIKYFGIVQKKNNC